VKNLDANPLTRDSSSVFAQTAASASPRLAPQPRFPATARPSRRGGLSPPAPPRPLLPEAPPRPCRRVDGGRWPPCLAPGKAVVPAPFPREGDEEDGLCAFPQLRQQRLCLPLRTARLRVLDSGGAVAPHAESRGAGELRRYGLD